eukprot:scaffold210465_cov37-Tisochrysis_lutea.AAC.1
MGGPMLWWANVLLHAAPAFASCCDFVKVRLTGDALRLQSSKYGVYSRMAKQTDDDSGIYSLLVQSTDDVKMSLYRWENARWYIGVEHWTELASEVQGTQTRRALRMWGWDGSIGTIRG